jgi:hypothetical protein
MTTELTDDFMEDELLVLRWAENSRGTRIPLPTDNSKKKSSEGSNGPETSYSTNPSPVVAEDYPSESSKHNYE